MPLKNTMAPATRSIKSSAETTSTTNTPTTTISTIIKSAATTLPMLRIIETTAEIRPTIHFEASSQIPVIKQYTESKTELTNSHIVYDSTVNQLTSQPDEATTEGQV